MMEGGLCVHIYPSQYDTGILHSHGGVSEAFVFYFEFVVASLRDRERDYDIGMNWRQI